MEKNIDITNSPKFHSTSGNVMVTNSSATDSIIGNINAGFQQMGYSYIGDYNSNSSYNGIFDLQFTIGGGERCSSARAYLQSDRPNLFVMKNSVVTKIKFNAQKVATGVLVSTDHSNCPLMQLYANQEVILSAGALNTPKILLQSGIGQANDLDPFNIIQISNVPVGNNLQDHPTGIVFVALNPNAGAKNLFSFIGDSFNYLFAREGYLSNLGSTKRQLFMNLNSNTERYPDMQYVAYNFPKNFGLLGNVISSFGFKDEVTSVVQSYNKDYEILMYWVFMLNPKSTGTVKLKSANPLDPPKITTGFFSDPQGSDLSKMIRSFQFLQSFLQTPAMSVLAPVIIPFNFTNCQNAGSFWSSKYLECYTKFFTGTGYHPTGTAKMGNTSDTTAVINQFFQVKGVSKLRVVDASVFPSVPTGNTQCPTYTIAEYAADVIKQQTDWNSF